jgi:hypothetical protein
MLHAEAHSSLPIEPNTEPILVDSRPPGAPFGGRDRLAQPATR